MNLSRALVLMSLIWLVACPPAEEEPDLGGLDPADDTSYCREDRNRPLGSASCEPTGKYCLFNELCVPECSGGRTEQTLSCTCSDEGFWSCTRDCLCNQ